MNTDFSIKKSVQIRQIRVIRVLNHGNSQRAVYFHIRVTTLAPHCVWCSAGEGHKGFSFVTLCLLCGKKRSMNSIPIVFIACRVFERLIEINTLPGLTPDYSDLCLQAKAEGIDYENLALEILYLGASRWEMAEPRK
jgi:hypothetical protein